MWPNPSKIVTEIQFKQNEYNIENVREPCLTFGGNIHFQWTTYSSLKYFISPDVMSTDLILEMPHKYHNNIVNVILVMKDNNNFYLFIDVVYKGLLTIA